jgi:spoIIIJ-associated protein
MNNDIIKNLIAEFLGKMTVSFNSIDIKDGGDGNQVFMITTSDSGVLIGNDGANLQALNYLIKRIAAKRLPNSALSGNGVGNTERERNELRFYVDVNGYQEKNIENIKNRAKIMCERARSFKMDVELPPMSAYERMIVHSFLQGLPDIKTESSGQGKDRRIVIKYCPNGEGNIANQTI